MGELFYDIDELYKHTLHLLTKSGEVLNSSKKLMTLETEAEKVEMVYDMLKQKNLFPLKLDMKKCSEKSTTYRNIGNDYFKKKNDNYALKNYNQAIVFAPNPSRELSLAFANRSAVNFTFKNYKESLNDIENALVAGYDDNLKPKLLKRKTMCEEAISLEGKTNDIEIECKSQFRLSKEPHSSIPCATNNIEIAYSEAMGRSVIATDDIDPGDVIVTERPYCNVLLEPFYFDHCYECFSNCDSMLPCENCCVVMFCSSECRKACWERYHKIECSLMPLLVKMKFTKLELMAFRTVIQTKCTLSNWDKVISTINQAESEPNPLYRGFSKKTDISGKEMLFFDSLSYNPIHTLVTNIEKRSISDIFQKSVTSAVFLHFLIAFTDFFSESVEDNGVTVKNNIINEKKYISLIGGLLLHHSMTSPSNMHNISALRENENGHFVEDTSLGSGAYAFLSLFNHSCAQNVVRYCSGTTISLVVLRPIRKGQQLFDNYGFHHAMHSLEKRRESLHFQYKFQCMCEACVNNWPLYHMLPPSPIGDGGLPMFVNDEVLNVKLIDSLKVGNRSIALSAVKTLYPYISILENTCPNRELAEFQETFKQCWSLFGNINRLKM